MEHEESEGAQLKYIFNYSGSNNIGSVGTKLLVKAELPLLQKLHTGIP